MSAKSIKRRIGIVGAFLLFSVIHFLASKDPLVFVFAAAGIILTIIMETIFIPDGAFLFMPWPALIAGYFAGTFIYGLLVQIAPEFFLKSAEPYAVFGFCYLGLVLPLMVSQKSGYSLNPSLTGEADKKSAEVKLLDTSVVIDGRIADIAETGFISGTLILPKFVLNEIQSLADSKDPIKRSRARRGLDVLNKLKEIPGLDLKIFSRDFPEIKGVDAKLIALAKEMGSSIVTNDYNLNKVAKLDGIMILNLNDLANALKPVLLPGEEMELDVLKEGKENNQGIGYLSDGTMVVVASGMNYIGKRIHVKVTSILQTSAGRIIFTEPETLVMLYIGIGYDLHRLAGGRKLRIGGVDIPSEFGSLAHSDGDALLHALTDMILSPAGNGDIGQLFPDTDPRYQGMDSLEILRNTINDHAKNIHVLQVDCVVILDSPKIASYIPEMKKKIAEVFGIPESRVGIKGKTTENTRPYTIECHVVGRMEVDE